MNLKEAYLAGHKACGLKVGDKVKVLRKAEDHEQGWGYVWLDCMNDCIGGSFNILADKEVGGFLLGSLFDENNFCCPWFVLEKVEEQKIKTYDLDFGCKQKTVESLVQRIINYIDKEK